jgi:hypothetical protein
MHGEVHAESAVGMLRECFEIPHGSLVGIAAAVAGRELTHVQTFQARDQNGVGGSLRGRHSLKGRFDFCRTWTEAAC